MMRNLFRETVFEIAIVQEQQESCGQNTHLPDGTEVSTALLEDSADLLLQIPVSRPKHCAAFVSRCNNIMSGALPPSLGLN